MREGPDAAPSAPTGGRGLAACDTCQGVYPASRLIDDGGKRLCSECMRGPSADGPDFAGASPAFAPGPSFDARLVSNARSERDAGASPDSGRPSFAGRYAPRPSAAAPEGPSAPWATPAPAESPDVARTSRDDQSERDDYRRRFGEELEEGDPSAQPEQRVRMASSFAERPAIRGSAGPASWSQPGGPASHPGHSGPGTLPGSHPDPSQTPFVRPVISRSNMPRPWEPPGTTPRSSAPDVPLPPAAGPALAVTPRISRVAALPEQDEELVEPARTPPAPATPAASAPPAATPAPRRVLPDVAPQGASRAGLYALVAALAVVAIAAGVFLFRPRSSGGGASAKCPLAGGSRLVYRWEHSDGLSGTTEYRFRSAPGGELRVFASAAVTGRDPSAAEVVGSFDPADGVFTEAVTSWTQGVHHDGRRGTHVPFFGPKSVPIGSAFINEWPVRGSERWMDVWRCARVRDEKTGRDLYFDTATGVLVGSRLLEGNNEVREWLIEADGAGGVLTAPAGDAPK